MLTRKNSVEKRLDKAFLGGIGLEEGNGHIQKRIKFHINPKEQKPSAAEKKVANSGIQDHSKEI